MTYETEYYVTAREALVRALQEFDANADVTIYFNCCCCEDEKRQYQCVISNDNDLVSRAVAWRVGTVSELLADYDRRPYTPEIFFDENPDLVDHD